MIVLASLLAKRLPARLSRHHAVRAAMGETSTPPSATTAVPPELWWKAIKLPIFTVALVPLSVGAAAAYLRTGLTAGWLSACFAVAGMMVIAWLNLSNDAYDSETEVDKSKSESMVNLTGSRKGVLTVAQTFLLGAAVLLGRTVFAAGDPRVASMLIAAIGIGHIYQAPPFRLSYKGLGEPLCFVAFGPLATNAFYLALAAAPTSQVHSLSPEVLACCVLVGITTSVILFCSHFHQVEGDTAAGKRSPVVRLGLPTAVKVLSYPLRAVHALTGVFVAIGWLPWTCLVASFITLPLAFKTERFVQQNYTIAAKVAPAKIFATKYALLQRMNA